MLKKKITLSIFILVLLIFSFTSISSAASWIYISSVPELSARKCIIGSPEDDWYYLDDGNYHNLYLRGGDDRIEIRGKSGYTNICVSSGYDSIEIDLTTLTSDINIYRKADYRAKILLIFIEDEPYYNTSPVYERVNDDLIIYSSNNIMFESEKLDKVGIITIHDYYKTSFIDIEESGGI